MKIEETAPNFKSIIATEAAETFELRWPSLLVCFSVSDVFFTIGEYFKLEGLPKEVRDDYSIAKLVAATESAFLELLKRGALRDFVRVSPLPEPAQAELDKMAGVGAPEIDPILEAREAEAAAIATCVEDYRRLDGRSFKSRYLSTPAGRQIYETAISQGKI
jgi:hypothetical protein